MYFVGIDIAKHFHEADIIDDSDKVVLKKLRFSNSHDGYNKLMDSVRKLDGNFVFTMEAIGHYWLPLLRSSSSR